MGAFWEGVGKEGADFLGKDIEGWGINSPSISFLL
jgi:hypothetical protein